MENKSICPICGKKARKEELDSVCHGQGNDWAVECFCKKCDKKLP